MITKQEAISLAKEYLNKKRRTDCLIIEDATIEEDFGWIFQYQNAKFLETGNLDDATIGNAPILVDKANGTVQGTGTAFGLDFFVKVYKKYRTQILSGKLYYPALIRRLAHSYADGDMTLEKSDAEIADMLTD